MSDTLQRETVATLLTPSGVAAIAVLRLVGPRTREIVHAVFQPCRGGLGDTPDSSRLRYGRITDGAETLDDVLVSLGGSGGDIELADITAHGGERVVARILRILEERGAVVRAFDDSHVVRAAWPAANRVQREADVALVRARTRYAVEFLAAQRRLLPTRLTELTDRVFVDPAAVAAELARLAASWEAARFLVHGAEIGVIGPPNAGKSTLTNRLAGQDAVLASEEAGTTRDWTAHESAMNGIPIRVIDTAGVADSAVDGLTQAAMYRGIDRVREAELHILVVDGTRLGQADASAEMDALGRLLRDVRPSRLVIAVNKADLGSVRIPVKLEELHLSIETPDDSAVVQLSAERGDGFDALSRTILRQLGVANFDVGRPSCFTHRQAEVARSGLSGGSDDATELLATLDQMLGEVGAAGI